MKKFTTTGGTDLPITNIKGKDYLDVKWRLVWFRQEKPNWRIETKLLEVDKTHCLARAEIKDDHGNLMATGHKNETPGHFADFIEKAETSAIGRALALVGYGTQFCADELDEGNRLADSPVDAPNPMAAGNHQPAPTDGHSRPENAQKLIAFGKWNKRSYEEIYKQEGPDAMGDYAIYLTGQAEKTQKPLSGPAKEYVDYVDSFLVKKSQEFNSASQLINSSEIGFFND